ncbi:MAG: NERD domain-containing protein [Chloroflexota bacterium]|nr:NERD domain-containing protein [Chloroflexota bacterium]
MQVARNDEYVQSRKRMTRRISIAGFVLLIIVFASWFLFPSNQELTLFLPPIFFAVFVVTNLSKQLQFEWGAGLQADERIAQALRHLNNRYWFGAYIPLRRIVVNNVLVGPEGVQVFATRNHPGQISCTGGKWRRKASILSRIIGPIPPLGNPTRDVTEAVDAVRAHLNASGCPDVPIAGALVFLAPNVVLELDSCPVTALTLAQLEGWAARRRNTPNEVLSEDVRRTVQQMLYATLPEAPSVAPARKQ